MMFLQLDFPAMLVALLAALSAALVGNVLVLRRQALMGDALSHMVLPGVVGGYILTGDTKSWSMVLGALVAALAGAGLIVMIRRLGRLDAATAMGVVLTMLFALGVVMLELADASNVHLDIEHALYGSLEAAIWIGPLTWQEALAARPVGIPPPRNPHAAGRACCAGHRHGRGIQGNSVGGL